MIDLAQAAREAAAVRKAKLRGLGSLAAVLACAFRKGGRDMIAWIGRRLWPAAQMVIRAVRMANDEQVYMWECVLLTSGTASLSAAGPLRGVRRWTVTGSSAATCRPRTRAKRGGNPGWRPQAANRGLRPTARLLEARRDQLADRGFRARSGKGDYPAQASPAPAPLTRGP